MTTNNKTCPFCGGTAIHYVTDGDKHFIGCDVCGSESEDADSAEGAWCNWNTRPVEPDSSAAVLARIKEMSKNLVIHGDGHIYLRLPDGSLEISAESDAACRAIAREVIRYRDAPARPAAEAQTAGETPPESMTPLKTMAYAHCRARSTPTSDKFIGPCEPDGDCSCVAYMRAALLALAGCEDLDRAVIESAGFGDEDHARRIEKDFRAVCRALAEKDGSENHN